MNTINTIMTNTIKQINNNTIMLTRGGESKLYFKIVPGVDDFTIRDLSSYIKYKGEHYA